MATLKNFINGALVDSRATSTVPVISPSDGSTIAQVPLSTAEDVNVAVHAGKEAFASWSTLTIKQRAGIMLKFHALVNQHAEELAQIIVKENGKNITEAMADVAKGNETVEWACSMPQMFQGKILEVSRGIECR